MFHVVLEFLSNTKRNIAIPEEKEKSSCEI